MSICPPCAQAADVEQAIGQRKLDTPLGHDPAICRDHGLTPNSCGCAHRPAGTATPKGTARA